MKELTSYEQWDLWLRIAAKGFPRPDDDEAESESSDTDG